MHFSHCSSWQFLNGGVINVGYYDFTRVLPEEEKQRQQISRTSGALLTACDSRSWGGCGGLVLFVISCECAGPVSTSISHEDSLLSSRNIQVWQDGNNAFNLSPARICSMETLASRKLLICHYNGCMWVSGIKRRPGPDTELFYISYQLISRPHGFNIHSAFH